MACHLVGAKPSNQCWNIVNWILKNKPEWNFNLNSNILHTEVADDLVTQVARISAVMGLTALTKWPQWTYFSSRHVSHHLSNSHHIPASAPDGLIWANQDLWVAIIYLSDNHSIIKPTYSAWYMKMYETVTRRALESITRNTQIA